MSKLGGTTFGTEHLDYKEVTTGGGGSCDYPAATDVRDGEVYGGGTGTLVLPAVEDVESGVQYGAGGTEFTGTLVVAGDYPAEGDVQQGVTYNGGANTGTFVVPTEAQVESGVSYGAAGTEFTGTFTGGTTADLHGFTEGSKIDITTLTGETNTNLTSMFAKSDGTKIYVLNGYASTDELYEFTLSTPWDGSTATLTHTSSIGTVDTQPKSFMIDTTGTKLLLHGDGANKLFLLTMSIAWDLSTLSLDSTSTATVLGGTGSCFSSDGKQFYSIDTLREVHHYTLDTAWNVSAITDNGRDDVEPYIQGAGIAISEDGLRAYVLNSIYTGLYSWDLPVAYVTENATPTPDIARSFDDIYSGWDFSIYGFHITADGQHMLVGNSYDHDVHILAK